MLLHLKINIVHQVSIGPVLATCLSSCIYTRVGAPGSRFCFARGSEEVHCLNKGGRPTTPSIPSTTTIPPIRTQLVFVEDGKNLIQENAFHENTGVLEIMVPAHANYTETKFVIHDSGVLMKTKGTCSISSIHKGYNVSSHHNSFTKEMARRLQRSDNRLDKEPKYHILKIRQERIDYTERQKTLHPAHSSACDDAPIVKTKDQTISEAEHSMLKAGKIIYKFVIKP